VSSWSFSPDRSRLALATVRAGSGGCVLASLRVVDTKRLRTLAGREFGAGELSALAWLGRSRLLALYEGCGSETKLLTVDIAGPRIVASENINGVVVRAVITTNELVALVAPEKAIGPGRLVVLSPTTGVRSVSLQEILTGQTSTTAGITRSVLPGLASSGRHAYVIPAAGPVAEVDLDSLRVSYHDSAWRHVAARAKASEGTTRHALPIGDFIAVFGRDDETFTDANGRLNERGRPSGLDLIDTRNWSIRTLDDAATWAVVGGERLFVTRHTWDSSTQTISGMGIAAYDRDGQKRFHLFPGKPASVALVYRNRAYVHLGSFDWTLVVEVSSGHMLGLRRGQLPSLLLDRTSSYWRNGI
jgi:hypothetical protein